MNVTNVGQSVEEMRRVVGSAEPGHKFKLVFTDSTFDGELGKRLLPLLAMNNRTITFGDVSFFDLEAVASKNNWRGIHSYTFTVLGSFKPAAFIAATIDQGLLVSIEKIADSPVTCDRPRVYASDSQWQFDPQQGRE